MWLSHTCPVAKYMAVTGMTWNVYIQADSEDQKQLSTQGFGSYQLQLFKGSFQQEVIVLRIPSSGVWIA